MAKKFLVNVDLGGNQLLNALAHPATSSPTALGKGQLWFDTTNNQLNVYNGTSFQPLATGGTAVSSLNAFTGAVAIYGTSNQITVTNSSGSITLSFPSTISGVSANFTGASVNGSALATQTYVSSASVAYATSAGNAATVTNGVYTTDTGTVTSTMIADGTIVNGDISSTAAITPNKLSASAITIAGTGVGLGGTLSSIEVSYLSASTVTVGSTAIGLGGTATTITGLSSINSTSHVGTFYGNATTATNATTVTNGVYTTDTGTVTSTMIADGTIVNADISSTAAIIPGKLSASAITIAGTSVGLGGTLSSIGVSYLSASSITIAGTTVGLGGTLSSIGVSYLSASTVTIGSTAIGLGGTSTTLTGLTNVNSTSFVGALYGNATTATNATTVTNGVYTTDTGTVTSTMIADGTIVNGDISATAAIIPSKLSASSITIAGTTVGLGGTLSSIGVSYLSASTTTIGSTAIGLGGTSTTLAGLTNVNSTSFVGTFYGNATTATNATTVTNGVYTTDTGTVTSTMIANNTIVDADINSAANINVSKLSASAMTLFGTDVGLGGTLSSVGVSYLSASTVTLGTTAVGLGATATTISGFNTVSSSTVNVVGVTESTGTGAGALVVSGGAGIAKNVYVGGNLNVSGSVYIGGTAFQVSASSITLNDPMIYLAHNNPANLNDLGMVVSFNNGTYQHSGVVRDATDGVWKVFSGVIPEPDTTVNFASAKYDPILTGGLIVNSGSTTTTASVTSTGSAIFAAVIKSGGTSSQFLKADGSVDSSTYLTSTGSINTAYNSASLGNLASTAYAQLSSANFTSASMGGFALTRKYVGAITGNAAATSFALSHNLGTQDVTVQVYQTSATPDTQYAEVEVDIVRTSASVVTVSFATAPAASVTYNAVIVG